MQRNSDIRKEYKSKKVHVWQIAERMGKSENWVYRHLNKKLTESERREMFEIIAGVEKTTAQERSVYP